MNPYQRLLRWYPRAWREAHGDVLLALLRDADDDAGRTRPTRSDAWAVRVHGAAERLTAATGWALATAGALASLMTVVNVFALLGVVAEPPSTGWELVVDPWALVSLLAGAAAPALVSLGVVALLRNLGVLSAAATVLAATAACAAWCLAALTSSSLGVGYQRLNADLQQTAFGAATPVLFLMAAVVGTLAAAAAWDGVLAVVPALHDVRGGPGSRVLVRRLVATVLGTLSALLVGMAAFAPYSTFLVGVCVAAACLLRSHRSAPPAAAALPSLHSSLVVDARCASAAGQLAVAGLAVGLVGLLLVAMGPAWREALQERGILQGVPGLLSDGRLLSCLAGAVTALAVGLIIVPRWGRGMRLLVGATCAALLLQVISAVVVALVSPDGHQRLWPLLAGGLLVGLAATARSPHRLPGSTVVRWSARALVGAAVGLTLGSALLALMPLLMPLAAAAVLLVLLVSASRVRRPRHERSPGGTAHS